MAKEQTGQSAKKLKAKTPVTGWRTLTARKPKVTIRKRQSGGDSGASDTESSAPPTFWGLMVKFLPVWLILIILIAIDPLLPVHLASGVVGIFRDLGGDRPIIAPAGEPIYIIEGAEVPVSDSLPPPDWPLEISPVFTPEVQFWGDAIASWSLTYRIRPNMMATIMQIESCGNPDALSPAGAQGLFQVLDLHFDEGEDPFDPNFNAMRGMLFFGELLGMTNGDTSLAFAAYNGGPSVISISPTMWPQETQSYQFWASGIYEEAERGFTESPTLIEWLNAGGVTLCADASEVLGLGDD